MTYQPKTEHTPLPWNVQRAGTGEVYIEGAACVDPVTNARPVIVAQIPSTKSNNPLWRQIEERDANAYLIVRAVKAHAGLVVLLDDVNRCVDPRYLPYGFKERIEAALAEEEKEKKNVPT